MRFSTSIQVLLAAVVVGTTSVLGNESGSFNVRDVDTELAARREGIVNFMEARGRGGFGGRRGGGGGRRQAASAPTEAPAAREFDDAFELEARGRGGFGGRQGGGRRGGRGGERQAAPAEEPTAREFDEELKTRSHFLGNLRPKLRIPAINIDPAVSHTFHSPTAGKAKRSRLPSREFDDAFELEARGRGGFGGRHGGGRRARELDGESELYDLARRSKATTPMVASCGREFDEDLYPRKSTTPMRAASKGC